MADTRRELAALQTLTADNSSGLITAQVLRDMLISEHGSQTVQSGPYAAIPVSGQVTGDIYCCTDGPHSFRWDGSIWVPFGPTWKLGNSTSQSWSWVNQGSATIAGAGASQHLYAPSNGGTNSMRARVMTAPATPYTFTALLATQANWSVNGYSGAGIFLRESGTQKMISIEYWSQTAGGTPPLFKIVKWSNSSTISSTPVQANFYPFGIGQWAQVGDDGTNVNFNVSPDGFNWITVFSETRATFFTTAPDQAGFGLNPYSQPNAISILSWNKG